MTSLYYIVSKFNGRLVATINAQSAAEALNKYAAKYGPYKNYAEYKAHNDENMSWSVMDVRAVLDTDPQPSR